MIPFIASLLVFFALISREVNFERGIDTYTYSAMYSKGLVDDYRIDLGFDIFLRIISIEGELEITYYILSGIVSYLLYLMISAQTKYLTIRLSLAFTILLISSPSFCSLALNLWRQYFAFSIIVLLVKFNKKSICL